MRRSIPILLFFLVLVTPFLMRRALLRGVPRDAVLKEGSPSRAAARLVVVTPHNQDIRREFGRAFSTWHAAHYGRAVEIDYRTPGGTVDIKRQLDATYARYRNEKGELPADFKPDIDVVFGGGDFFFDVELRGLKVLRPLPMTPAIRKSLADAFPSPRLAGVKLYDQDKGPTGDPSPKWVGVCLSSFGIVYNPDVFVKTLGLPPPRSWADLTDPKLAGMIALADPTHSGSAGVAYQMVIQRRMADAEAIHIAHLPPRADRKPPELNKADPAYRAAIATGWHDGMAELLRIAANARYFTDSSTLVPTDVGNGEAAAGMSIDFYGRVCQETLGDGRCIYVSPPAATAITPDPVAILAGVEGERLELAAHFVEFLLSPDGQRLWILAKGTPGGPRDHSLRRPPIRVDLFADQAGWTDHVNPFTDAGGFNQRGEWMALYSDTRPLWAAAWIDAADDLKAAYARVRAVTDPARRAALLDRLSDLPVSLDGVKAIADERKRIESANGPIDEWCATKRIEWAEGFRKHYRAVAAEAN